nr:CDP-alcohol phosphatidyltransferase family protein [Clostridia bacterium]
AGLIVLSGLTDLVDGWYARRFNAVSDVGKVLDPIADKLTQAAAIGMLIADHPLLLIPLVLLLVKEMSACVTGYLVIHKTGSVPGAVWHGKATTALLYLLMFLHILWQDIPSLMSNTMMAVCVGMMLLSMTLYTMDRFRRIRGGRGGS